MHVRRVAVLVHTHLEGKSNRSTGPRTRAWYLQPPSHISKKDCNNEGYCRTHTHRLCRCFRTCSRHCKSLETNHCHKKETRSTATGWLVGATYLCVPNAKSAATRNVIPPKTNSSHASVLLLLVCVRTKTTLVDSCYCCPFLCVH